MYLRTVKSKTKKGVVEYLQLCHNFREDGTSKTRIIYNFGRKDNLDLDHIRRLINSLAGVLPEKEAKQIQAETNPLKDFRFIGSRQLGGSYFLDQLWHKLNIDKILKKLLKNREYKIPIERLIYAMVANRALAPTSKLDIENWVADVAYIPDLSEVEVHQLYRAMDFLLESSEAIQEDIFFSVANLFNLEVDILFLDTTSTYFETMLEDKDDQDQEGLRKRGYSKDNHPELPQVVIGFAVTKTGIPVRCWVWPGNTSDKKVIKEVKKDLNFWKLNRIIMVQDTGFNNGENKKILQEAGGHYIIGEKMRLGPKGAPAEALKAKGRYTKLDNGLEIKDVTINADSEARRRYIVVRNPEEAKYDQDRRNEIVDEVNKRLDELKQLEGEPHNKAACELRAHSTYGRYIKQTKTGKLRLDKGKIRLEEKFDGKYLISTSDDWLPAEDVVMGYKQLYEIERVFRGLKHVIDIRPVNHRLPERIKAHVLLCWIAMLMIRVVENNINETWFQIKKKLFSIKLGINSCSEGEIHESSPLSGEQKKLFSTLGLNTPPRYFKLPISQKK
jgi:transposase